MATRSVVGYVREDGVVRGAYVHNDGYPEHMLEAVWHKLQKLGFEGIKKWIDAGVEGQGYSTVNSDPYNDGDELWLKDIDEEAYGYTVYEEGVVATQNGVYVGAIGDLVFSIDVDVDQEEYIDYVKQVLIGNYEISFEDANKIVDGQNLKDIVRASPEFVMHYEPEDWAKKLYMFHIREAIKSK